MRDSGRPRAVDLALAVFAVVILLAARGLAAEADTSATPAGAVVAVASDEPAAMSDAAPPARRSRAPLGFAGRPARMPSKTDDDFLPLVDRWRVGFPRWTRYPGQSGEYPYTEGHWWDPYGQNVLKGDYPVLGQNVFFALTGVSDTLFEARRIPTPTGLSTDAPRSERFFGRTEQFAVNQNFVLSVELFQGDSQFKPRDWEFRVTPVFNVNYVDVGEQVVNVSPAEGSTRTDGHIGMQELFAEVHLADLSPNYDFISSRWGIQGFTSDFRGFIFSDNNLGVRLFGNYEANRDQYNLAYFRPLEKNTNSGLNILDANTPFDSRQQDVVIANVYRQDFLWPGYTVALSAHYNRDHADRAHFDNNGFLVRPAPIGTITSPRVRFHDLDVVYLGWAGDGHIGRLNVDHAFYQALGRDERNPIAGHGTQINAQLAALELSVDRDWLRFKGSFLYASGDDDATDAKARGFDTILDNTNFAGGGFSYWSRQGLPLTGAGVALVNRFSVLPSLRSSKLEGQPNFVNPGLFLYNLGFDAELTPTLRAVANLSYLQFVNTDSLERLLEQRNIGRNIGIDYSLGVQYRPLLSENIILAGGAAALTPAGGFRDVLIGETLFSTFVAMTLTY